MNSIRVRVEPPRKAMIQGEELTDGDIGRIVAYQPPHAARPEFGTLSTFSHANGAIWVRFAGPTGERCPPEYLKWGHR